MSILDLAIAVVVLVGLWRGFHQGAIKTALLLMSWLIALILATRLASDFSSLFVHVVDSPVLQMALGFLLVFLVVISLLQLIAFIFTKILKILKLSFLDRLAGAVLGAGVGLLKVLVALSLLAPLLVQLPLWDNSPLAQSLLPFAPMAKMLILETANELWQELNNNQTSSLF